MDIIRRFGDKILLEHGFVETYTDCDMSLDGK